MRAPHREHLAAGHSRTAAAWAQVNRGWQGKGRSAAGLMLLAALVLSVHTLLLQGLAWHALDLRAASREPRRMVVNFVRSLQQAAPVTAVAALAITADPAARARPTAPAAAGVPPKRRLGAGVRPLAANAPLPSELQPEPLPESSAQAKLAAPAEAASSAMDAAGVSTAATVALGETLSETPSAPPSAPANATTSAAAEGVAAAAFSAGPVAEPRAAAAIAPNDLPAATTVAAFDWPPSTRLSYVLTGHYDGPVHGTAQVQWLRSGQRYQVHLDVSIGILMTRRSTSEGVLGAQGLQPLRYDEVTAPMLGPSRRQTIEFAPQSITLANGRSVVHPPGVQDSASHLVQLTWLFSSQPQRLKVGAILELPLALPRRLGPWAFEVVAEEVLDTAVGRVLTYHVKPRADAARPGELAVEAWFAPSLQYLPVRLLIRQNAQNHADLVLERLPEQAAPEAVRVPAATGVPPLPGS